MHMKQVTEPLIPTRILVGILLLAGVISSGVLGYHLIDGVGWFDSLYLSVVNLSTLGDSASPQLSRWGRLLTVFVVLGGFGVMSYVLLSLVPFVLEGHFVSAVS